MPYATFERFEIKLPRAAVRECSHQGACDADVARWLPKLPAIAGLDPAKLRAELAEYGAWEAHELEDHRTNCERILWLAAGNIQDEQHEGRRGRK